MAMIFEPLPRFGLAHAGPASLGGRKAPVDERFLHVQITFVVEGLREDVEDGPQHTGADPPLKPPASMGPSLNRFPKPRLLKLRSPLRS
jgi:hypothetical protein